MIPPSGPPGADAFASKLTVAPGATTVADGANVAVGGSSTVTVRVLVLVCPKLFVTISATVYDPRVAYVCWTPALAPAS